MDKLDIIKNERQKSMETSASGTRMNRRKILRCAVLAGSISIVGGTPTSAGESSETHKLTIPDMTVVGGASSTTVSVSLEERETGATIISKNQKLSPPWDDSSGHSRIESSLDVPATGVYTFTVATDQGTSNSIPITIPAGGFSFTKGVIVQVKSASEIEIELTVV